MVFVMPKKVLKHADTIYSEWDALAKTRFEQITSGDDLTFNHVLAPCLIEVAKNYDPKLIIDAGCGVGVLSEHLAQFRADVVGVDPSKDSIKLAKIHFGSNATFVSGTLEDFAADNTEIADLIVSNMVIMDATNLSSFVGAAAKLLKPGGGFVFSMGHPCFWPHYVNFFHEEWFEYKNEQMVELPFKISNGKQIAVPYTHIHRSLSTYTAALKENGFSIEQLIEPLPTPEVEALYPRPWEYPRFLVLECKKR